MMLDGSKISDRDIKEALLKIREGNGRNIRKESPENIKTSSERNVDEGSSLRRGSVLLSRPKG